MTNTPAEKQQDWADENSLSTADMLEIWSSGGNGSEYLDGNALINKAIAELRQASTRSQWKIDKLVEALEKLTAKLELIHGDPRYQRVWSMYMVHGGKYQGQNYAVELSDAVAVITSVKKDTLPTSPDGGE